MPDFCATNSLVRKIPACLCQIQCLDSRQTEAGVARTLIARLKAAEFLPNSTEFLAFRGYFEVGEGVDHYHRAL